MNKDTQDILEIQLAKIPDAVRQAFQNIELNKQLSLIAQRNGLHVDQAGAVERETLLTLLGLEHPDAFVQNLSKEGGFSAIQAQKIAQDVNENIFKNIRHSLAEMAETQKETELLEKSLVEESSVETKPAGVPPQPAEQRPHGDEHTMPGDIAKTKLEQSFRMPPQNTTVNLGNQTKQAPASGVDPYREPIE